MQMPSLLRRGRLATGVACLLAAAAVAGALWGPPPPQAGGDRRAARDAMAAPARAAELPGGPAAGGPAAQSEASPAAGGQDRGAGTAFADGADGAARMALAAAALQGAVMSGLAFADELAAARAIGLDERSLEALEPFARTGLPTRRALMRELPALLPQLQLAAAAAKGTGEPASYLSRLRAGAVRLLRIRPAAAVPGDDPAAIVSRVAFTLVPQDAEPLAIAAELDRLPAPAAAPARDWLAAVRARQGALEAARTLAIATLHDLAPPASSGFSPP